MISATTTADKARDDERPTAEASGDVGAFLEHWAALDSRAATPFQAVGWLRDWYATIGKRPGLTPVCVTIKLRDKPVALLPFIAVRKHGLSIVKFASEGITDYSCPLIGDMDRAHFGSMWPLVKTALRDHDLLHISNMLGSIENYTNPLATALPTIACATSGHHVHVGDDWQQWRGSLKRAARHQFERIWRVFLRAPDARFEQIESVDAALAAFTELEEQQRVRMREVGEEYHLDDEEIKAFYRRRIVNGLRDGSVVMATLRSEQNLVAALFGIGHGNGYVFLRLSHAGHDWKQCSPGSLILERTAHHLHASGGRMFDFGTGDHRYKSAFNLTTLPLLDSCVALSWKGIPHAIAWKYWRQRKERLSAKVGPETQT